MTKEEKINILNENIDAIENKKWMSEYIGGGYSYSENLTSIFTILGDEEYYKIYNENKDKYNKRDLEQKKDPNGFTLIECIVYFNWIWYVEGSGLSSGTIGQRIREGKYLKALKRLKTFIENS